MSGARRTARRPRRRTQAAHGDGPGAAARSWSRLESPFDRGPDVSDADMLDARTALTATAALMMTGALAVARNGHVLGTPRPVPHGAGRAVQAHDGRADCGGEMERTGIARQHEPRAARKRQYLADPRRRRQSGCSRRRADDRA